MKTMLIVLLLVSFFVGAGYYGLPIAIERETRGLKSEVLDVKQRLEKAEEYIRNEEEARKITQLQPDAEAQKIIKAVNSLSSKMITIEDTLGKGIASTEDTLKSQKTATEDALKRQTEAIEKLNRETQVKLQKIMLDAAMANIRGHIAKARTDLLSKNIATAKTELELIGSILEALKTSVSIEGIKSIEELESMLKKARSDVDTDLPAAINKIDLLWHEMSKLLRKG